MKEPQALDVLRDEIHLGNGMSSAFDGFIINPDKQPALALQGSLLLRAKSPTVAEAFCLSRLDNKSGWLYGNLPTGTDNHAMVERAQPAS